MAIIVKVTNLSELGDCMAPERVFGKCIECDTFKDFVRKNYSKYSSKDEFIEAVKNMWCKPVFDENVLGEVYENLWKKRRANERLKELGW